MTTCSILSLHSSGVTLYLLLLCSVGRVHPSSQPSSFTFSVFQLASEIQCEASCLVSALRTDCCPRAARESRPIKMMWKSGWAATFEYRVLETWWQTSTHKYVWQTHTVLMCSRMNHFFFFFLFFFLQPHLCVYAMIKGGARASLSAVRVLISESSLRF